MIFILIPYLSDKDIKICETAQNQYNATKDTINENIENLQTLNKIEFSTERNKYINDLKILITHQKNLLIDNIVTYFNTAYKFGVNSADIIQKMSDLDFNYIQILNIIFKSSVNC